MNDTLTAVAGIAVGHAQDEAALTGCTAILLPEGTTAGVDVRGGAPGTRETDLLAPTALVRHINAICLSGGSAFGLAAATGVMEWLRERGVGFETGVARVPIVPAAVIFDLGIGEARWPDAAMGYAACAAANGDPVAQGCVGAGMGAAAGKILGVAQATKSGLGSATLRLPGDVTVAALVVTNPFGDLRHPADQRIIAGARAPQGGFIDTAQLLRSEQARLAFGALNTTLAVVATDAALDKAGCRKLAEMAQDALPRAISPIHTPFDGDIVFAVATGARSAPHMTILGSAAAEVLVEAILRSALHATSSGGLPAARDLGPIPSKAQSD